MTDLRDLRDREVERGSGRAGRPHGGVLEVAVAVGGGRDTLERLVLGHVVQAALELGQDDPEQQVAPGGLRERAAVVLERLEVAASGVVAVYQHAERPEAEV